MQCPQNSENLNTLVANPPAHTHEQGGGDVREKEFCFNISAIHENIDETTSDMANLNLGGELRASEAAPNTWASLLGPQSPVQAPLRGILKGGTNFHPRLRMNCNIVHSASEGIGHNSTPTKKSTDKRQKMLDEIKALGERA